MDMVGPAAEMAIGQLGGFKAFTGADDITIDTGISGLAYKINFDVAYVQLNNGQLLPSSSKQYSKMMTIKITDNYSEPLLFKYVNGEKVRDTLQISYVNTYWFYD